MTRLWRNRTKGALHFHSALHAQESHGKYLHCAPQRPCWPSGLISFLEPSAMLALQPSTTPQALNDWCELCTLCSFSGTEWLTWKVAEKKPNRKVKSCVPSAESPWGRAVTQRGAPPPQHPLQGQAAESLWCSPAPGGRDMGAHPLCQDRHAVQQP